jgi:hypothetical protein
MSETKYTSVMRNTLGVFAALVLALLVVGVAWASGDDPGRSTAVTGESETSNTLSGSVFSTPDDSTSSSIQPSTSTSDDSTATTLDDDSTSSTIDDDSTASTVDDDSTATTVDDDSTSTTVDDDSTSTTIDDSDDRDGTLIDATKFFAVGSAGSVVVEVRAGQLILVDVDVNSGWSYEVEKDRGDEIEIRFSNLSIRAEFEARIHHGALEVEIETSH